MTKKETLNRILLIYDPIFTAYGGGEKVLISIVKALSPVDVFVPVLGNNASIKNLVKEIKSINRYNSFKYLIKTSNNFIFRLSRLIFLVFSHKILYRVAHRYTKIFVYTSFDMFSFKKPLYSKKFVYMNTPSSYLWRIHQNKDSIYSKALGILKEKFLTIPLRNRSITYLQDADMILCISKEVSIRIKNIFNKDAKILYVPSYVQKSNIDRDFARIVRERFKDGFFLVVTRILFYKNIQYLIDAYSVSINQPLFIVGDGPFLNSLKRYTSNSLNYRCENTKIANYTVDKIGNIYFWGRIPDKIRNTLYKTALATFALNNEDWGLTKIESLIFGTPVIAYKIGSNLEVINKNINGIFFDQLSPMSIKRAIDRFNSLGKSGIKIKLNPVFVKESLFINNVKMLIDE